MLRRFSLALGLALFCVTAAAKAPVLSTPVGQDLPVELVLNQNELAVQVPDTASAVGMQFGLIGALVGGAIQNAQAKKAEERVVPLRDLLVQYHFNERLEAAMRAKLPSEGISPNPQFIVRQTPWDAAQAAKQTEADANAAAQVLVIVPHYAMTYDFKQLSVSLNVALHDRIRKANGKYKTKVLFNRAYTFDFPMVAPQARGEDEVARWTSLGTGGLSSLLDEGIAQTTDMLVHDLSPAGRAEWTETGKGRTAVVAGSSYPGVAVRQGEGWAWVRSGKGYMHSLRGHHPLDAAALTALASTAAIAAGDTAAAPAEAAVPAVAGEPAAATSQAVAPATAAESVAPEAAPEAPAVDAANPATAGAAPVNASGSN